MAVSESSSRSHDDVLDLDPTRFTRRELLAAARGDDPDLHPVIAVRLLAQKRYANRTKNADLSALLDSDDSPARVRTAAAIELGRLGNDAAVEVLTARSKERKRTVRDPAVAGLRELARVHGEPSDPLTATVRAEVSLARVVAGPPTLPPVLYLDEERAHPITTRKATARQLSQVSDGVQEEIGTLGLGSATGREVRCADRSFVVLTLDELVETVRGLGPGAPSIAAAVAGQDTQETGDWDLRYFVTVTPGDGDVMELRVGTRQGRVAFAGEARLVDEGIEFSVRAVASPGSAPAVVEGRLDADGLRFSKALSAPDVAARMVPSQRRSAGR